MTPSYVPLETIQLLSETSFSKIKNKKVIWGGTLKWDTLYNTILLVKILPSRKSKRKRPLHTYVVCARNSTFDSDRTPRRIVVVFCALAFALKTRFCARRVKARSRLIDLTFITGIERRASVPLSENYRCSRSTIHQRSVQPCYLRSA